MQNGICEAFNGRMRDEPLNETIFYDLDHGRAVLARWVKATTTSAHTPRSATSLRPPMRPISPQREIGRATPTSFADRPLLHRRFCANLNTGLCFQLDDRRGSQQAVKIILEPETADDIRTMFRLRIDAELIGEGLTAVQAHVLIGEILERIVRGRSTGAAEGATTSAPTSQGSHVTSAR